jgi:hypothetical protein
MDMAPAGSGRLVVALVILSMLALLVWQTMEPGKYRALTWVLLGFFAVRVLLGWARSRKMGYDKSVRNRDRLDV